MVDYEPKWNSSDWDMPSGLDSQAANDWRYQRDMLRDLANGPDLHIPSSGGGHSGSPIMTAQLVEGVGTVLWSIWRVMMFALTLAFICALGISAWAADWYLFLHGFSWVR